MIHISISLSFLNEVKNLAENAGIEYISLYPNLIRY